MNIVYALTRNLYPYIKPTLKSLLEHNSPRKVYILAEDDSLPFELPEVCSVINVSEQKWFAKNSPNMNSMFTWMAMCRACYCEILPDVEKVLQLDIDTIVCDSLEPLWGMDINGKWFAACPEHLGTYNPFNHDKYYNIGVCLYNVEQMRKDNAQERLVQLLNTRRLPYVEQDALNCIAVPDKATDIPVRYNECFCCGYTDNPAIVHYAGVVNWQTDNTAYRHEYLDRYR